MGNSGWVMPSTDGRCHLPSANLQSWRPVEFLSFEEPCDTVRFTQARLPRRRGNDSSPLCNQGCGHDNLTSGTSVGRRSCLTSDEAGGVTFPRTLVVSLVEHGSS